MERCLLAGSPLVTSLSKQLLVLLLPHSFSAFLNKRSHGGYDCTSGYAPRAKPNYVVLTRWRVVQRQNAWLWTRRLQVRDLPRQLTNAHRCEHCAGGLFVFGGRNRVALSSNGTTRMGQRCVVRPCIHEEHRSQPERRHQITRFNYPLLVIASTLPLRS